MNKDKRSYFPYIFIFVISFLLTFDLFFVGSVPSSFDGLFHFSVIAQFVHALSFGDFPVRWADGFANYGSAIPLLSHQLTSYLGAFLYFIIGSVVTSSHVLYFIGSFLSGVFLYRFLKLHVRSNASALAGVFLFTFTSYRILNVYIRGALPEYFSGIFVPVVLIGIHRLLVKKETFKGFLFVGIASALLTLNHPMMLMIYAILFGLYGLFIVLSEKPQIRSVLLTLVSFISGVGIASYYVIPLLIELRYFYYGTGGRFAYDHFLFPLQYVNNTWRYVSSTDIFTRAHILQPGIIETGILFAGAIVLCVALVRRQLRKYLFLAFAIAAGATYIFLTLHMSAPVYRLVPFMQSVQFGWRMLGGFIFVPPMVLAYLADRFRPFNVLIATVILVAFLRFPQLYGKNYQRVDEQMYFSNHYNAHSVLMQTVWSGASETYPVKKHKAEVIEGEGSVFTKVQTNTLRKYEVEAADDIRMIDYTFYFPGWKVYVDSTPVPIEFQDVNYRGVITYDVPKGEHEVVVVFEDTKVRLLANVASIVSLLFFLYMCFVLRKTKIIEEVQKAKNQGNRRSIFSKHHRGMSPW